MKRPHSERRKSSQSRIKPLTADANPADCSITKRLDNLETRLHILEKQTERPSLSYRPDAILYPQKHAGRKPVLNDSWLLSMRERIIQVLEPRWPELAEGISDAKTLAQLRAALLPLADAHDPTLDLIVQHAAILWDFLQSDRFRAMPDRQRLRAASALLKQTTRNGMSRMLHAANCLPTRQIAAAMAGPLTVPGRMSWRTSLARCGKMPQFIPLYFFPETQIYFQRLSRNLRTSVAKSR